MTQNDKDPIEPDPRVADIARKLDRISQLSAYTGPHQRAVEADFWSLLSDLVIELRDRDGLPRLSNDDYTKDEAVKDGVVKGEASA